MVYPVADIIAVAVSVYMLLREMKVLETELVPAVSI
jgi:hypothetical protein